MEVIDRLSGDLHTAYCDIRAILRILSSPKFQELYSKASEEDQNVVTEIIEAQNKLQLNLWIQLQTNHITVENLRKRAAKAGIANYTQMNKYRLLSELSHAID